MTISRFADAALILRVCHDASSQCMGYKLGAVLPSYMYKVPSAANQTASDHLQRHMALVPCWTVILHEQSDTADANLATACEQHGVTTDVDCRRGRCQPGKQF